MFKTRLKVINHKHAILLEYISGHVLHDYISRFKCFINKIVRYTCQEQTKYCCVNRECTIMLPCSNIYGVPTSSYILLSH
jgi:hypothetical protein